MKKEELMLMLQEGETHKIEFKESLGGIDKEIVAFANSSGGRILLGVRDDGTVKGIKITNKLKSQIRDIANNCEPKIKSDQQGNSQTGSGENGKTGNTGKKGKRKEHTLHPIK